MGEDEVSDSYDLMFQQNGFEKHHAGNNDASPSSLLGLLDPDQHGSATDSIPVPAKTLH